MPHDLGTLPGGARRDLRVEPLRQAVGPASEGRGNNILLGRPRPAAARLGGWPLGSPGRRLAAGAAYARLVPPPGSPELEGGCAEAGYRAADEGEPGRVGSGRGYGTAVTSRRGGGSCSGMGRTSCILDVLERYLNESVARVPREVAGSKGATTTAQAALARPIRRGEDAGVTITPIAGAAKAEHVEEAVEAAEVRLSDDTKALEGALQGVGG